MLTIGAVWLWASHPAAAQAQQSCVPPAEGMVAWYPGDGDASDIEGGNTGYLLGGVSFAPGKVGQAFSFSGGDGQQVVARDSENLDTGGQITIDAWILPNSLDNTASIVNKRLPHTGQYSPDWENGYAFEIFPQGGLKLGIRTDTGTTVSEAPNVLTTNTWQHVAATYDGSTMRIYVNGAQVGAQPASGSITPAVHAPLVIGSNIVNGNSFNGLIDEVSIYNRALYASEIQSIYNAGTAGKCKPQCTPAPSDIVAWYPGDGEANDVEGGNGYLLGGVEFVEGKVGQAFRFFGGDGEQVVAPHSENQNTGAQIAIDAWILPYKLNTFASIVNKRTTGNSKGYTFELINYSDKPNGLQFQMATNVGDFDLIVPNVLTSGVWQHVAVTYDGSAIRIYVNGVQVGIKPAGGSINPVTADLVIGRNIVSKESFDGLIDEVTLYHRALSPSEIQSIYNAGTAGKCKLTDKFADAPLFTGRSGTLSSNNKGASKEPGEPDHAGVKGGKSVWMRWRAPFTGPVVFSTFGSAFDTLLAAYTGSSINSLPPVSSNDDDPDPTKDNTLTSRISFNAVAGTTYYIAVDGGQGRSGTILLNWGPEASISGQVSFSYPVTVRLSDPDQQLGEVTIPSGTGSYTFRHLRVGAYYRVSIPFPDPTCPLGSNFWPLTDSVSNINFSESERRNCYCPECATAVFGTVTTPLGLGIPDVILTVTGSASATGRTGIGGLFGFPDLKVGNYTITPSYPLYKFDPPYISNNGDLVVNFTATPTFTISGQARDSSDAPISGVMVTVSNGAQTRSVPTNGDGLYEVSAAAGDTYTVTASKPGLTFKQSTLPPIQLNANKKDVDFIEAAAQLSLRNSTFSALSSPTITYGTPKVTLSGKINGSTSVPTGSVQISLAAVTTAAPINSADGSFSADFSTASLGASSSPYPISYSYAPSGNFGAASGSGTLTVNKAQATITLSNLNQTYDGRAKGAQATTNPAGLSGVTIRYSQNGVAVTSPINVGSYTVVASLNNDNYQASDVTDTLVIANANPVPTLSSISPTGATAGGSAFTLTVNGAGFVGNSVIQWNNSARPTVYVSPTQLTATISSADIATAGPASVTVTNPAPGSGTSTAVTFTITQKGVMPTAAQTSVGGRVARGDGAGLGGVVLTLTGGANLRRAITDEGGRYRFEGVEAGQFYTVTPEMAGYRFTPASLGFSLTGEKSDGLFTARALANPTANPLDSSDYFVRQQYLDFLGREPDQAGLDYWSGQIRGCGNDQSCVLRQRVAVSAAYFTSQEFQETGYFVYLFYKASYGQRPTYAQFIEDRGRVIGGANLDSSKQAFAEAWVQRADFLAKYPASLTGAQFIDALLQTVRQGSGVDLSGRRAALIDDYTAHGSRARALRQVAEDAGLQAAEYNRGFVLMQYFGYLRRDPDGSGYDFWLNVLNNRDTNNFQGMVCAFITSREYQQRFSPVRTYSNGDCGNTR